MSEWMGAEDHVHRALEHFERGRWAQAEAELRKALAEDPDRGEWQFNLGMTLESAGRPREALECYRRAMELMPEEPEPAVAAGTVCNGLGRHEECVTLLARATSLRRDDDAAYATWIDSLVCLDRLEEAETTFHLAQLSVEECPRSLAAVAEALIRRRDWVRAEWCLRSAMRLEPAMPRVRARLACVLAATGGVERAVQLYTRELRDDPGCIDTQLDFADLLARLGRLPEADERYRRVLELEPANVDAHRGLGRIALRTGRSEQALLELELVAKLDPSAPAIRLDLAEALLALDRGTDAARPLREELELLRAGECQPELARLGALLLRAELATEAVEVLSACVASMEAAQDRGRRLLQGAGREGAELEAAGLEAAGLEDGLVGELERRGDDAAPSRPPLELAPEVAPDPGLVDALRQLALARYAADDLAGGVVTSKRVLRLDPGCVRSRHNLALAMLRLERPCRAAAFVRSGLRLDPHDDGLRRLRARVWMVALLRAWRRTWRRT